MRSTLLLYLIINENVAEFCVRQTAATLGGNEQHDEEIPVGGDGNGAEV